ncbi:MAG: hypothetical protein U1E76_12885 [Planctomycetota bacterium]
MRNKLLPGILYVAAVQALFVAGTERASGQGLPLGRTTSDWEVSAPVSLFATLGGVHPRYPTIESASDDYVYALAWAPDPAINEARLYLRTRMPSGVWLPAVKVSDDASGWTTQARLAVTRDGGVLLAAWPAAGDVHLALSRDHGQTFSAPVAVDGPVGLQVDVAIDREDGVHLAWRAQDATGVWDVYYAHSLVPARRGLPLAFSHWQNLTNDPVLQDAPSIAVDDAGNVFVAFVSAPGPSYESELIELTRGRTQRRRLQQLDGDLQVSTGGLNMVAPFFRLNSADQSAIPYALVRCAEPFDFWGMEIPTSGWRTIPGKARSSRIDETGMITVLSEAVGLYGLSVDIELTRSFDCGRTFTLPIAVTYWTNPPKGHWGTNPALAVDRHGTAHMLWDGPYQDAFDGFDIIYVGARYVRQ